MKKILTLAALAACTALAPAAHAADPQPPRVDHYQAKKGGNIEETVAILRDANKKLAELLAGEVGEYDMHDIHSLCYTIEDSLKAINAELRSLSETAADLHFATEGQNRDAVIDYGDAYLSGVRKIIAE
ncbi:DUF6746 family protein [Pseudothauera rhizosphaerae]|uniref:Uncharacterized protein n=1 Tax=Pseudothauera rhizosphaerae TaxID=2565932 RepID=A0A4S4ACX4_9RHOO|nr:DUF6746 family protein [Pseudothauera rhizosphaerae]THF56866.1 hypothetical protein E6O51_18710 [Pseudothauera rhizosphaerae]